MKRWMVMAGVVTALGTTSVFAAAPDVTACYNQAGTQVQYVTCLKEEQAQLEEKYRDVLDQVTSQLRTVDRAQKNKKATQAFSDANKAFLAYLKEECELVGATRDSEADAGGAEIACRINLMRMRLGALRHQFLLTH